MGFDADQILSSDAINFYMLSVGLTGGIGSGKSAVSDSFARHGIPILDTDIIARELVEPGQPALREIVELFGPDCLDDQGRLNRPHLRRRVFADPEQRHRLEAVLHPRIRQTVRDRLAALSAPYCIVVIPLLVEAGMRGPVQRILVVDVPVDTQMARVKARDRLDDTQVKQILAAQASREERLAVADDVLVNDGDLQQLELAVARLHRQYLQLAGQS